MNDDRKEQALVAWRRLLEEPDIRMDAVEQYDELLKLADEYKRSGMIDNDEWRELVEEARAIYARATEGLDGGT